MHFQNEIRKEYFLFDLLNTGPSLRSFLLNNKSIRYAHNIVIDKQEIIFYMHGSLPSAHKLTDFV